MRILRDALKAITEDERLTIQLWATTIGNAMSFVRIQITETSTGHLIP